MPAWAAKPLALTRHEGRIILVLPDPGSETVDRFQEREREQPLDLARFLRSAINLATALGHAHQRGLIHKDVKPESVLVDDDGHVWLAGFVRLLAKNAGERCQTAAGQEADLRRCLSGWRFHGRIDPFRLGTDDSSNRLLIPEKLYGRGREIDSLVCCSTGWRMPPASFESVTPHVALPNGR
jgi:serine/threonine protein kinase